MSNNIYGNPLTGIKVRPQITGGHVTDLELEVIEEQMVALSNGATALRKAARTLREQISGWREQMYMNEDTVNKNGDKKNNLTRLRELYGLNLCELGDILNISPNNISYWEHKYEQKGPNPAQTMVALSVFFHFPPEALVSTEPLKNFMENSGE